MKQKILTALLIIISVLPPLYLGGIPLRILMFAICGISSFEIVTLRNKQSDWPLTLFIFLSIIVMYNVDNVYYVPMLSIYIIVLFFILIIIETLDIDLESVA